MRFQAGDYGRVPGLKSGARTAISMPFMLAAAVLVLVACGGPVSTAEDRAYEEYEAGLQLEERGNLNRAFEAYSRAIELDRTLAVAYSARAHVYFLHDNLGLALIDADLATAHLNRGLILAGGDAKEDALLSFSKAIQLAPTLRDAYYGRARLYYESEDLDGAIEDLTSAIEISPKTASLYLTRGQVFVSSGDTASAVADLERVLALSEDATLVVAARQLLSLVQ